jgi:hypothetical protein
MGRPRPIETAIERFLNSERALHLDHAQMFRILRIASILEDKTEDYFEQRGKLRFRRELLEDGIDRETVETVLDEISLAYSIQRMRDRVGARE